MARYRFTTVWEFRAPLRDVWGAILNSLDWPQWWPGVLSVHVIYPSTDDGVGNVRRYAWRSVLPYTLVFDMRATKIEPLVELCGIASGEVEGSGRWTFTETGDICTVRYVWDVRTVPWWMNVIAPIARPLIKWNHDIIMSRGARGVSARLNVPLIRETNHSD